MLAFNLYFTALSKGSYSSNASIHQSATFQRAHMFVVPSNQRVRYVVLCQISPNGHPIGHGHPEPIAEKEESDVLDHKSEAEHLASVVRDSAGLKTSEEFKGLLVGIFQSCSAPLA